MGREDLLRELSCIVLLGGSDLTGAVFACLFGFFLFLLASLAFTGLCMSAFLSGSLPLCDSYFSWSDFLGAVVSHAGLVSDSFETQTLLHALSFHAPSVFVLLLLVLCVSPDSISIFTTFILGLFFAASASGSIYVIVLSVSVLFALCLCVYLLSLLLLLSSPVSVCLPHSLFVSVPFSLSLSLY